MLPGDSLAPLFAGDRVEGKWNMALGRAGGVGAALACSAALMALPKALQQCCCGLGAR